MNLVRCRDQKGTTLEEQYSQIKGRNGSDMLAFLRAFRALPFEKEVFGLTSCLSLNLLSVDTHTSRWWVTVLPTPDGLRVSCVMGEPIPGRTDGLVEFCQDPKQAAEMALAFMEWSGGWKG